MTERSRVAPDDAREIADLVTEWAWLLDHGRFHEVAELLTDDGVFLGFPEPLEGRAGFRAWADARAAKTQRRTHHQMTNLRLTRVADDRVDGTVSLVLRAVDEGRPDPAIEFVGEYADELLRTERGWRFRRRRLVPLALEGGS